MKWAWTALAALLAQLAVLAVFAVNLAVSRPHSLPWWVQAWLLAAVAIEGGALCYVTWTVRRVLR